MNRDRLAEDYLPLARRLAWDHISRYPAGDADDVLSDANLGLLQAARRFDGSQGIPFHLYARRRIAGAIADGRRNRDNGNRTDQALVKKLDQARYALAAKHGRFPTKTEIAVAVGRSETDLDEAFGRWLLSRRDRMVDIDAPPPEDSHGYHETIPDPRAEEDMLSIETRTQLAEYLPRLKPNEHMTVALYYWDEMTLAEIGDVLGVTESRASQILTAAKDKLRRWITADVSSCGLRDAA